MDHSVTSLLHQASEGNNEAFNRFYENVYDELRQLASRVRYQNAGQTLNTTAIVHEAYFKLIPQKEQNWQNKNHFLRIAARAMRQVLMKHARYKSAEKRGGEKVEYQFEDGLFPMGGIDPDELISLDQVLKKLEEFDERQAKIVEYRFFAGMSVKETAEAFGVSVPTVKRDWRLARAWMIREMGISGVGGG